MKLIKEIIDLCKAIFPKPLKIKMKQRRKGDPPILIASCEKAKAVLKWRPQKTIRDIIKSAWKFEQKL